MVEKDNQESGAEQAPAPPDVSAPPESEELEDSPFQGMPQTISPPEFKNADDAATFAAAEARRAEAYLQIRELELRESEAKRLAEDRRRQDQLQVDLEREKQRLEAEARKAEAAQQRESQEQVFELRKNAWSTEKMRGLVSLLLVMGFLATTGIVIFLNATGQAQADLLQTVASLYSGITGAVLGFYFGRQQH